MGLSSAAIARSAVRTNDPLMKGYVTLLESLLDAVAICTLAAVVIVTTVYEPGLAAGGETKCDTLPAPGPGGQ